MDATPSSGPQHVRALERANQVRRARALVKRRIASGQLTAAEVVLSHRWEIESMPVAEVLLSQRQWGRKRCDEFLLAVTIGDDKSIGSMTTRQRIAVAAMLTANTRARPQDRSLGAGPDLARSAAAGTRR
jgi:hypothetical protein